MGRYRMGCHGVRSRGRERAGLALVERQALRRRSLPLLVVRPARRNLQEDRRRVVEQEVREVLELVGVEILLELADDRAEGLRLRKYLDVDVKRLRTLLEPWLSVGETAPAVSEGLLPPESPAFTLKGLLLPVERLLFGEVALRACFADGHPGVLLRPVGREVDRTEVQHRCIFRFHQESIISYIAQLRHRACAAGHGSKGSKDGQILTWRC